MRIPFVASRHVLTLCFTLGLAAASLAAEDQNGTRMAPPVGGVLGGMAPPAGLKDWLGIMPPADLHGWTRIAIPPTNALGHAQWHLDTTRQVLLCDGDGGHEMLRFDQELTNCSFHVECRFVRVTGPKTNYNSGIFIRNSADGAIWHQCQLTRNGGYLFGNTPVGGQIKHFKSPASERRMKPAGEWNIVEVTAQGRMLTVWLNGVQVSQFGACDAPAGYLALEAEATRSNFEILKMKELP